MAHMEAEPKLVFFAPTALRIYRHRDTAHGRLDLFVSSYEFLIPELTYVRHFGNLLPYFENSCHGTNLAPRKKVNATTDFSLLHRNDHYQYSKKD